MESLEGPEKLVSPIHSIVKKNKNKSHASMTPAEITSSASKYQSIFVFIFPENSADELG